MYKSPVPTPNTPVPSPQPKWLIDQAYTIVLGASESFWWAQVSWGPFKAVAEPLSRQNFPATVFRSTPKTSSNRGKVGENLCKNIRISSRAACRGDAMFVKVIARTRTYCICFVSGVFTYKTIVAGAIAQYWRLFSHVAFQNKCMLYICGGRAWSTKMTPANLQ